ncbi:MAG: nitrilase-related carbon-nitrogen hydrolase [Candidatus Thorarchaeota archaeon]|jgi:predicted amidohydrolase
MLRVGFAQIEPMIMEVGTNIAQAKDAISTAIESDVDILVLPELANSGYVFESTEEVESTSESIPDGPFCRVLRESSSTGMLIVSGICERIGSAFANSAAVFSDGEHSATYRKVHLFNRESQWFDAGTSEPPVLEYRGAKFGVMVCFDWAFPEMARILAIGGAQVILHPANLVLPYCQNAMITRSIENRVFTITANRIGEERGLHFSGNSQVTSPRGEVLVRAHSTKTALEWVDIDPSSADDKMITKMNHVLNDRKPEIYRRLIDPI